MTSDHDVQKDILKTLPHLRAFAISLAGDVDRADDLVQEAVLRGLSNLDKFTPGISMQAWLFTILRNQFHTGYRRRRREVEDPDGTMAGRLSSLPEQDGHLHMQDLQAALTKLPLEQREALLLVAAEGFSYEEAAQICGVAIGTIKSRINRARARLSELLRMEDANELDADPMIKAVTQHE